MLYQAAKIAEEAHRGQKDKTGRPYIEHLRRVADAVETLDEKTVAYLHDVVEKGEGWTLDRLEAAGFGFSVVAAVDALTRRLDESEQGFVYRAASNEVAVRVKEADLKDNLWQAHQAGVSPAKYEIGLQLLDGLAQLARFQEKCETVFRPELRQIKAACCGLSTHKAEGSTDNSKA